MIVYRLNIAHMGKSTNRLTPIHHLIKLRIRIGRSHLIVIQRKRQMSHKHIFGQLSASHSQPAYPSALEPPLNPVSHFWPWEHRCFYSLRTRPTHKPITKIIPVSYREIIKNSPVSVVIFMFLSIFISKMLLSLDNRPKKYTLYNN